MQHDIPGDPAAPPPSSLRGRLSPLLERVLPAMGPVRASEAESIIRELFGLADVEIGGTRPGDITVHDPRFY
jgi:hypothetical protein